MCRRGTGWPTEGDLYSWEDFRASVLRNREDGTVRTTNFDVGRALNRHDVEALIVDIDCFARLYFEY
jgi:hypothetical protein